jgi:HEAT repeat protein
MRSSAIALASVIVVAFATGCPKDPYDADTWIDKLDDPAEAGTALQRLQQLKDPKAIAPLGKFWRKHNYPSKVLRIIIDLAAYEKVDESTGKVTAGPTWEPAVPFLIEAIDNFDIGDQQSIDDATIAADALGMAVDAGVNNSDIVTTLVNASKKKMPKLSPGQRVRIAAVRSLGKTKSPQGVDVLIEVLRTDANKQPIKLNAAAANALADAADPKSIQPLLMTIFDVPPIYQQCRTALTSIGKPVVPELVKLFQGKHDALEKYAKEQNFANNCSAGVGPTTTCRAPGALKFKAAALLGDFHASEHVKMLAAELKEPPQYSFFDPQTGAGGPPQHNAILDSLRTIGDPLAANAVYDYWNDANTRLDIKPIAMDVYSMIEDKPSNKVMDQLAALFKNDAEDEGVRLAAALAYGRMVTRKKELEPLDYMIARFKKPADENAKNAEAEAKKAEKFEAEGKELEAKAISDKKNQQALMKKANAAFAKAEGHRDEQSRLEGVSNSYRGYQKGFEENKWRAEVGIECGEKPECYAKYLEADDIRLGEPGLPKAERALITLTKMGQKAQPVLDQLLAHADSADRIIRQGVLLALPRVAPMPCDKCVARLTDVIEKQKDQTTLDYLTSDTRIVLAYFQWAGR